MHGSGRHRGPGGLRSGRPLDSATIVATLGASGYWGGPSTTGFALRSGRAELTPQQDVDGADAAVVALRTGKREHMAADPASRQPDLKT